jgi:hypothetical protein
VARWSYYNGNWLKEEMEATKIKVEVTWIRTKYRFNLNVLSNIQNITFYTRVFKIFKYVQIKNKSENIKNFLIALFCDLKIKLVLSYLIDNVPKIKISK